MLDNIPERTEVNDNTLEYPVLSVKYELAYEVESKVEDIRPEHVLI